MPVIGQGGKPGYAGSRFQHLRIDRGKPLDKLSQRRSRTNKAHVTPKHVPKLRNLVKPTLAKEMPDRRDATGFVASGSANRSALIRSHRAQFPQRKTPSRAAHPFGNIENRPSLTQQQPDHQQAEGHRQYQAQSQSQQNVAEAFCRRHLFDPNIFISSALGLDTSQSLPQSRFSGSIGSGATRDIAWLDPRSWVDRVDFSRRHSVAFAPECPISARLST